MKTRIKDFLDIDAHKPAYSFQYLDTQPLTPRWVYPSCGGTVLTWSTTERRDRARSCFTHRRSPGAALLDLRRACLAAGG